MRMFRHKRPLFQQFLRRNVFVDVPLFLASVGLRFLFAIVFAVGLSGCSVFFSQAELLGLLPPGQSVDPANNKPVVTRMTSLGGEISTAAPISINGKVIFIGGDYTLGNELWVHDPINASTTLLKDIFPGPMSSEPQAFHIRSDGSLVFFIARDSTGYQVWRTDGSASGTIRLTNHPQQDYASTRVFKSLGASVAFLANDGVSGFELWKSDGSAAGTVLIKDINPGSASAFSNFLSTPQIVLMGGRNYFVANDGVNGAELWSTDGTSLGTQLSAELVVGAGSGAIGEMATLGTNLFFTADAGGVGRELYISDGTQVGTSLLKDIRVGASSSSPQSFFVHGAKIYFIARQAAYSIWESDGTSVGTIQVNANVQIAFSSTPYQVVGDYIFLNALQVSSGANGALAINLNTRTETVLGAGLIFGVVSFISSFIPGAVLGDTLIIPMTNSVSGGELWAIDTGDVSLSRSMITDINPGGSSGVSSILGVKDGKVVFLGDDGVSGLEVWSTDGTAIGTSLIKDTFAGATSSKYGGVSGASSGFVANDRIYFTAARPGEVPKFWVTDGTTLGTAVVQDSPATWAQNGVPTNTRYPLGLVGSKILFKNYDSTYHEELWTFDPISSAVGILKDISASMGQSIYHLYYTGWFSGKFLFNGWDPTLGESLWISDGTTAGTTMVIDTYSGTTGMGAVKPMGSVGTKAIFGSYDTVNGQEIWSTDISTSATVMTGNMAAGVASFNTCYGNGIEFGGFLYFCGAPVAPDPTGFELYKTNGMVGGTSLVKNISPAASASGVTALVGTVHDGYLYFAATDGVVGVELWRTDGTDPGTTLVKDINIGAASSIIALGFDTAFLPVEGGFIFQADDGTNGRELWFSDGTAVGTQMISELRSGTGDPTFTKFVDLKSVGAKKYVFYADDGVHGLEPFVTDGTAAGTFSLGDLYPGTNGSAASRNDVALSELAVLSGAIYFTVDDGVHGPETWVSNGTVEGTKLYAETVEGVAAFPIRGTLVFGTDLYIFAMTGIGAPEIFKIIPPQN